MGLNLNCVGLCFCGIAYLSVLINKQLMDFCEVMKLCSTECLNNLPQLEIKICLMVKIEHYYVENVTWRMVRAGGCPVVAAQW